MKYSPPLIWDILELKVLVPPEGHIQLSTLCFFGDVLSPGALARVLSCSSSCFVFWSQNCRVVRKNPGAVERKEAGSQGRLPQTLLKTGVVWILREKRSFGDHTRQWHR